MASLLLLALLVVLLSFVFLDVTAVHDSLLNPSASPTKLRYHLQALLLLFQRYYPTTAQGKFSLWEMVQLLGLCSTLSGVLFLSRRRRRQDSEASWKSTVQLNDGMGGTVSIVKNESTALDAESTDPGLLKKHSQYRLYATSRFLYPSIRVVFRRHPQADKLPTEPAPLPLLVFIHGLGGSAAQFHPLMTSLVNVASCLAIDLPGCGLSTMRPSEWEAYTTEALAELVATIIEDFRESDKGQGVVLIGHSMGCSLAAMIASKTSPIQPSLADNVVGLVAICPKADPPNKEQTAQFRKLLWVPGFAFDLWRKYDRRGGTESASVRRFVGADADTETKKLQERFNEQSKTPVWRRMASGSLPKFVKGVPRGGLPGGEIWAGITAPVFLVAGESDHVTKPAELAKIAAFLGKSHPVQIELDEKSEPIVDSADPVDASADGGAKKEYRLIDDIQEKYFERKESQVPDDSEHEHPRDDPSTPQESLSPIPPQPSKPRMVLKTTILPPHASHALLYMPSTCRILAGLISDFLCSQVSPRLSLGWQLQYLSTAGKWDVKNLAKWQAVAPVSAPIAGVFRAMKTLREVDESHCPAVFVKSWGHEIKDIVDISHESPVYDPRGLENGGIRYHKFPTVSKIPPTDDEVTTFIGMIDRLREEQKVRKEEQGWEEKVYVGVHCHYGFNRTGYFIVCYLVERCGFSVQGAIDEFARCRPKGIKHAHFLDRLFVRYCVGLKRAPTL